MNAANNHTMDSFGCGVTMTVRLAAAIALAGAGLGLAKAGELAFRMFGADLSGTTSIRSGPRESGHLEDCSVESDIRDRPGDRIEPA